MLRYLTASSTACWPRLCCAACASRVFAVGAGDAKEAMRTLVASLFLGSAVYTVLHIVYSRRFGRPLWLVRLQRSGKSGRRVAVVNSLPLIVLLVFLSAPLLCASCILLYRNLIDEQPGYHYIAVTPAGNVVVALQAWIFSASNLHATLTSRRRLGAKPSVLSIPWVSNFVSGRLWQSNHLNDDWSSDSPGVSHGQTMLGFPAVWAIAVIVGTPSTVMHPSPDCSFSPGTSRPSPALPTRGRTRQSRLALAY